MLTHTNITANCEMLDSKMPYERLTLPTTNHFQDTMIGVLPFFHIYGFTCLLISRLALGCKMVTLPKFQPETFIATLAEHKSGYLNLVPPLVMFLANDERIKSQHLAPVRTVLNGAAPIGQSDVERLKKKYIIYTCHQNSNYSHIIKSPLFTAQGTWSGVCSGLWNDRIVTVSFPRSLSHRQPKL